MYKYVSWLPTVAGRLSYRHIGNASHPTQSTYENAYFKEARSRIIVGYQERDLSDAYFKTLTHWLSGRSGKFLFTFSAVNCTSDPSIFGNISIFFLSKNSMDAIQSIIDYNIKHLRANKFQENYIDGAKNLRDIEFHSAALSDISVKFKLKRTGEVEFSEPEFSNLDIQTETLRNKGNKIDFEKWIADQTYFFMRDIVHVHQHHENSTDTILLTQPSSIGEEEWRSNILYSLYYHAIALKRHGDSFRLAQAEGILAYAQSFSGISRSDGVTLPKYQRAALLNSLSARTKQHASEATEIGGSVGKATLFLTYILPSIAIIFTLLSPFMESVANKPELIWINSGIETFYVNIIASTISLILLTGLLLPLYLFVNRLTVLRRFRATLL